METEVWEPEEGEEATMRTGSTQLRQQRHEIQPLPSSLEGGDRGHRQATSLLFPSPVLPRQD